MLKYRSSALLAAIAAAALIATAPSRAFAEATLLIDADSGKVLHAENATYPWYPASLTKLMTTYVTLKAIREGRITLDTLFTVSARAAAQAPSKMGFKPGTTVTVDNALKMLLVKSANDIAFVIAEGVDGSVEKFAEEMTSTSRQLGMTQSNWVNPNGLPADEHISSARDLAMLARALIRDFSEYDSYWHLPGIKFGKKVVRNFNPLIGRYPGADGMKTGFICASGFNLVATATRRGKRLIAVVLGAPSGPVRAVKAAALLERGFNGGGLAWLTPSLGTVDKLQPIDASPPDLREEMCGPHRKRPAAEDADEEIAGNGNGGTGGEAGSPQSFMLSSLPPGSAKPSELIGPAPAVINAVVVFTGAAKKSAEAVVAAVRDKIDARKAAKDAAKEAAAAAKNAPPKANPTQTASAGATVPVSAPKTAEVPAAAPKPAAPGQIAPPAQALTADALLRSQAAKAAPGQIAAPAATTVASGSAFAPPAGRFTPPTPALPAVGESNPAYMSFAPTARAEDTPAPLTATPAAAAAPQVASVPMPRPRPKVAATPHDAAPR